MEIMTSAANLFFWVMALKTITQYAFDVLVFVIILIALFYHFLNLKRGKNKLKKSKKSEDK